MKIHHAAWGTKDKPTIVPSMCTERLVGCICELLSMYYGYAWNQVSHCVSCIGIYAKFKQSFYVFCFVCFCFLQFVYNPLIPLSVMQTFPVYSGHLSTNLHYCTYLLPSNKGK